MKKVIAILSAFVLLISLFAGCSSQGERYVILLVSDANGDPIEGISVYAEKHPEGWDIFPGPEIGITNEKGEVKYSPEDYGEENLVVGYFYSGKEMEWDIIPVEITRADAKQHITIRLTYSPEA